MINKVARSVARDVRHKRVRRKVFGTKQRPRLCVFRSLSEVYAQIIDDSKGVTLISASTREKELKPLLKDKNKTEQAKIIGAEIAKRASAKKIKEVVFDRGGNIFTGRVKALADGAREEGLKF